MQASHRTKAGLESLKWSTRSSGPNPMLNLPNFTQRPSALLAKLLCDELYCLKPGRCMDIVDATYDDDEYLDKPRSPNEKTWNSL